MKLLSILLGMQYLELEDLVFLKSPELVILTEANLSFLRFQRLVGKVFDIAFEKSKNQTDSGKIMINNLKLRYEFYYRFIYDLQKGYWEIWEIREYQPQEQLSAHELMRLICRLL